MTARQLADALGCSERNVFRLTRRICGKSPLELVRGARIREADRLLAQGIKVQAIALLVGYRSSSSFYRAYRVERGEIPIRR